MISQFRATIHYYLAPHIICGYMLLLNLGLLGCVVRADCEETVQECSLARQFYKGMVKDIYSHSEKCYDPRFIFASIRVLIETCD